MSIRDLKESILGKSSKDTNHINESTVSANTQLNMAKHALSIGDGSTVLYLTNQVTDLLDALRNKKYSKYIVANELNQTKLYVVSEAEISDYRNNSNAIGPVLVNIKDTIFECDVYYGFDKKNQVIDKLVVIDSNVYWAEQLENAEKYDIDEDVLEEYQDLKKRNKSRFKF